MRYLGDWTVWSSAESVRKRRPSIMAVIETMGAVVFYCWLAVHLDTLVLLYSAALIAPIVLLRSDESIACGLRWFKTFEERDIFIRLIESSWFYLAFAGALLLYMIIFGRWSETFASFEGGLEAFGMMALMLFFVIVGIPTTLRLSVFPVYVFAVALFIRIGATLRFLPQGIRSLPENFRILVFCVSPSQRPELIPGLNETHSRFAAHRMMSEIIGNSRGIEKIVNLFSHYTWPLVMLLPAWMYRIVIKSTIWLWWPLVFVGEEPRLANKPRLLQWSVLQSLRVRVGFAMAAMTLAGFLATNLIFRGVLLEDNKLITPLGYLLLFDWRLRPWQIIALIGAILSLISLFWANDVYGKLAVTSETRDKALESKLLHQLAWIERLSRVRTLLFVAFWLLAGVQALLYFNSVYCFVELDAAVRAKAYAVFGEKYETPCGAPVTDKDPALR